MSLFKDCGVSSESIGDYTTSQRQNKSHVRSTDDQEYIGSRTQYMYTRGGKDYFIASGMLNSLFKTYGYCVDPGARGSVPLTPESIEALKALARKCGDYDLLLTIDQLSRAKAPSPRMVNDSLMHEITLNEKRRFNNLHPYDRRQTLLLLRTILDIGMYLAGWKGSEEPYITNIREVYDTVRVELKIFPLIQYVYSSPNYIFVKSFPIMGYFKQSTSVKPFLLDPRLNLDQCLNQISMGVNQEINNTSLQQLSLYLISTAYYYITSVCNTPLPMVEPLIHNIALE